MIFSSSVSLSSYLLVLPKLITVDKFTLHNHPGTNAFKLVSFQAPTASHLDYLHNHLFTGLNDYLLTPPIYSIQYTTTRIIFQKHCTDGTLSTSFQGSHWTLKHLTSWEATEKTTCLPGSDSGSATHYCDTGQITNYLKKKKIYKLPDSSELTHL